MSILKIVIASAFLSLFLACGETDPARNFSIDIEGGGKKFQAGQQVTLRIKSKSDQPVDSVRYFLEGTVLSGEDGKVTLAAPSLGNKKLKARVFTEGKTIVLEKEILLLAKKQPEIYTYEIVNTFPHDRKAFTQGLEFFGDTLYESTGRKGTSSLRKVDFRTGKILKSVDLEKQYFGEGITIMGDTVYMLTWQEGTGFLFNRESLEKVGSFRYGESKEGWGLCNDGKHLYKSDGTQRIWLLDPVSLKEEGAIQTVTNRSVFNKANELEFVNGKIYANVWQKESMMIIDAGSGAIEGVVNFGGLSKRVTQHRDLDVFNGVAYHPERQTFFVTGKNWDKLFEVRILKRE
ncbi:MAG: glutaminyl-peptide cyclotransferase [Robiginitalea sp.]